MVLLKALVLDAAHRYAANTSIKEALEFDVSEEAIQLKGGDVWLEPIGKLLRSTAGRGPALSPQTARS